MSVLNLTAKEVIHNVSKKLRLQDMDTSGREQKGDYYLDGRFQFTVTLPNEHGGSGGLTPGLLKTLRDSVFLNAKEYRDLVKCPMSGERYEQLIRERHPSLRRR